MAEPASELDFAVRDTEHQRELVRDASGAGPSRGPLAPGDRAASMRIQCLRFAIARATTTRGIADAVLDHAAWIGRRGALFLNVRGELRGWSGRGKGVTVATLSRARLSLGRPSILGYLAQTPTTFRGRIDHDSRSRAFLGAALSRLPGEITAFSIVSRGRVIGVAYADGAMVATRGQELARLGREIGDALARARRRDARQARPNHDGRISK